MSRALPLPHRICRDLTSLQAKLISALWDNERLSLVELVRAGWDLRTQKSKTLPGWCRNVANRHTARIKHVFKWATENELIPATIYHALATVAGLRKGRSDARETEPVRPAPQADVDAALNHLSPQVGAMVRLQLLTGARGGELRRMRTCDVDTSGKVWLYRPPEHKTAHHGHAREIRFEPKAIAVLAPFLKPDLQAIVFSPLDAEAHRREQQRLARTTPLQPSQVRRAEEARKLAHKRRRRPGDGSPSWSDREAASSRSSQCPKCLHSSPQM